MQIPRLTIALAAAVFGVAVATTAAQDLPWLVDQVQMHKSADSPGQVTFNHSTHVGMQAKPDCTVCHPKAFRILKADAGTRPAITHAAMEKGAYCGACHEGKKAFALQADCANCHKQ